MLDNYNEIIAIPSEFEVKKIFGNVSIKVENGLKYALYRDHLILLTGVSKISTTYNLTKFLSNNSNIKKIYLLGIAGAYEGSELNISDIISVQKDYLIDEATIVQTDNLDIKLTTMYEKGIDIIDNNFAEFKIVESMKVVNSNTVSLIQTDESICNAYRDKYGASIENMEGAAFGYIASQFNIDTYQIRSISNFCGLKFNSSWDVKGACAKLKEFIDGMIDDTSEL